MALVFFLGGKSDLTRALMIPVGGVVFLGTFWLFRESFKRRSGGLGFR
jgi:predicted membrane-bound mannosyltransferase